MSGSTGKKKSASGYIVIPVEEHQYNANGRGKKKQAIFRENIGV